MSDKLSLSEGLIFSDLAIKEAASGKVSLINVFSHINALAFPFQSPLLFLTMFVSGVAGGVSKIPFKIEVFRVEGNIKISELNGEALIPPGVLETDVNEIVWPMPPMFIQASGSYSVVITASGSEIGKKQFQVRPLGFSAIGVSNVT